MNAMPPRHAYWTIIIDDQPTAFRAHDPEELLPTLNRLREKNSSAVMKWFERGQLFDSRDQAREVGLGQGERRWEGPRPDRDDEGPRFTARPRRDDTRPDGGRSEKPAPRDKHWRPGGDHRDPRQKYKDAKKAKWNRFKDKIRERHEERGPRNPESFTPPHGDKLRQPPERQAETRPPRDRRPEWRDDRDDRGERSQDRGPREPWRPGPAAKPHGDKLGARARPEWRRDDERPGGAKPGGDRERRPWSNRPPRQDADREKRAWNDRPPRRENDREQRPWSDRPPRRENDREQRPWSDRPPKGPAAGRKRVGGPARKPWGGKPASGGGRKPWAAKPPGGTTKSWGSKPRKRRRDEE